VRRHWARCGECVRVRASAYGLVRARAWTCWEMQAGEATEHLLAGEARCVRAPPPATHRIASHRVAPSHASWTTLVTSGCMRRAGGDAPAGDGCTAHPIGQRDAHTSHQGERPRPRPVPDPATFLARLGSGSALRDSAAAALRWLLWLERLLRFVGFCGSSCCCAVGCLPAGRVLRNGLRRQVVREPCRNQGAPPPPPPPPTDLSTGNPICPLRVLPFAAAAVCIDRSTGSGTGSGGRRAFDRPLNRPTHAPRAGAGGR
jgi:hypothetical protein